MKFLAILMEFKFCTIVTALSIHGKSAMAKTVPDCLELEGRRTFLSTVAAQTAFILCPTIVTAAQNEIYEIMQPPDETRPFCSAAYSLKEYTNSIVASRDTNVSPLEVYETLLQKLKPKPQKSSSDTSTNKLRALDVGAGAGVSTQVMWDMGYREM